MKEIKNVIVEWISLVSKNETPAVEQAENKFALFKTKKKDNSLSKLKLDVLKMSLNKIVKNIW